MKPRLISLAALAGVSLVHAPSPARAAVEVVGAARSQLKMDVGKGELLRLSEPAATMFIADPKIADVQVKSPTLVYLIGKAPGATTFYALDRKEHVIANMAVAVGFDARRLEALLREQAPRSHVEVTPANGALILTGQVASPAEGDDVLRIASAFVGAEGKAKSASLVDRLTIDTPNQVYLQVRVAEVSRTATKDLGFNWESLAKIGAGGGFIGWAMGADVVNGQHQIQPAPNGEPSIVGGVYNPAKGLNINLMINALQKKGLVSILAEPNLTAVSGEPTNFLAGGEYPIPVPQGLGQTTIEYKKYGVSLGFVATILDGGRISLNVRPEVSELTNAGAITMNGVTVPALTTRQAETTVELASGQSFAIAGLMQHTTTQDLQKLPWIGDVPVLGQLFRSKSFERDQSELVIIVTPYLVKPSRERLVAPTDAPGAPPLEAAAKSAAPKPANAAPDKKG